MSFFNCLVLFLKTNDFNLNDILELILKSAYVTKSHLLSIEEL